MASLWQKWFGKKQPPQPVAVTPPELLIYNPPEWRFNGAVKIHTVDLEDLTFLVRGIREATRHINGMPYKSVYYDLVAKLVGAPGPAGQEVMERRLWVLPSDDGKTINAVLLAKIAEFGYDDAYYKSLAFSENEGEAQEGDDHFWRVNDVHSEWKAGMICLLDENNDGKLDHRTGTLTYWDFWRDTELDGVKTREFYIVMMDENGYFEIWRGPLIDSTRIEC